MTQNHHIRKKDEYLHNSRENNQEKPKLGAGVGEKLEEGYVDQVTDRVIMFGEEKIKKPESVLIGDKGAYTSTYIRLVNGILVHRLEKIKKLKEMDKNFDECIRLLQTGPVNSSELNKISTNLNTEQEIKEGIQCLIFQKGIAEMELEFLANSIRKKTEELRIQESEIKKKRDEIQNCSKQFDELNNKLTKIKTTNMKHDKQIKPDVFHTIKEELESLSQKQDIKKLSNAINDLILSMNEKNKEKL